MPFYCPALVRSAEGVEKQCRTQLGAADLQMLIDEEEMEKYDAYMIEKMQGTKVCGTTDRQTDRQTERKKWMGRVWVDRWMGVCVCVVVRLA